MKKKILTHKAVEEFYHDSDGYWVVLKDGYEWFGSTCVHEYNMKDVWESLQSLTKTK
jgi:hypothetical protein